MDGHTDRHTTDKKWESKTTSIFFQTFIFVILSESDVYTSV